MNLRRGASAVQMGLVAGVLAFMSFGVLQSPPIPGDTPSLEFGLTLLALGSLAAVAGWGLTAATRWGRTLGLVMATACGVAGLFGIYGLVVLVGQGNLWSRMNIAVLAVLLLMGITSVVLLIALPRAADSAKDAIRLTPGRRAAPIAFGFLIGLGASLVFSSWLSTLAEPPCCPA